MTQTMRERLRVPADDPEPTMYERLCRALCIVNGDNPEAHGHGAMNIARWEDYGEGVDAILAELREPPRDVIMRGVEANDLGDPRDQVPSEYEVERAFTAMIDAIRTGQ